MPGGTLLERLAPMLNKIGSVAALAVVAYLGETSHDGGFVRDVWMALKTASPPVAMVLALLLYDAVRERKAAQAQLYDVAVSGTRVFSAAGESINALRRQQHELAQVIIAEIGRKKIAGRRRTRRGRR